MIIIAGAGHKKSEKYISLTTMNCSHCNNHSFWILEKVKHFVTLFFMPVAPYKTEYLYYCSICGNPKPISKEEFEREKEMNAQTYNNNQ